MNFFLFVILSGRFCCFTSFFDQKTSKKSSISLFAPVSVFVTDSFFRTSPGCISVLITYYMGSDLSLKLVDQQRKKLAVRHEAFCKVRSRFISCQNLSWLWILGSIMTETNLLLYSTKDLTLSYYRLYATPGNILLFRSAFWNLSGAKGCRVA